MKVVASNETLEILRLFPGENSNPRLVTNEKQQQDARCRMACHLIAAWGMAAAMGDMLGEHCSDPGHTPVKPIAPSDLVIRICEVVDAAWNEMLHRGWIIEAGSMDE